MAIRYYDEILAAKIKSWVPDTSKLRVLKTDETRRLFETKADDTNDSPITMPFIALSRGNDIELESNIKNFRSFNGLTISQTEESTLQLNIIPIKLQYQLDIYTKDYEEGDEYLRQFLFKLINNPKLVVDIPYNDVWLRHTANIRVLENISDTSDIAERLYSGQFTRWSIQIELQDAFLFNVPYRRNWRLWVDENEYISSSSELEIYDKTDYKNLIEVDKLDFGFIKE